MTTATANGTMTGQEIVDLAKKHTLFEWSAQSKVDPIPVASAKGIYFYAGREALHRLQQPAHVRQHRTRRPARHPGHHRPGRDARLREPVHGHRTSRAS